MRRTIILTSMVLLMSSLIFAEVTWYGYYEFEGDYAKAPGHGFYFDYNKFRLDFDTDPTDNVHIGGDVVYKRYGGKTRFNISDFIHESYYAGLISPRSDLFQVEFEDTLMIDNLYLDFHHKYFELIIGRQQLPTGVGYAWNPTDIFNKKDIMDPTYEVTGVDAIQLNIPVAFIGTLQAIYQPEETFDLSTQYFQFKCWLPYWDVSLLYGKTRPDYYNYRIGSFGNPIYKDLYGITLEGDVSGIGLRTEFTANRINYDSDNLKYEYIVGADYTFENSLYVLGEYLHNDFGTEENETSLFDYLIYYDWQQHSLNQNYLFLMGMYPITDLIDATVMSIANLDDQSLVINPMLAYRIYENVELTFMGNIFTGDKKDEYGFQDLGIKVRLRAYF
ncbi:MAG: hypothetical protein JXQ65_14760 [Candidatus Marinimicrobia bacterium]|nr:hypothetical protein [Candidatus Neomarinimicrobiota bacterium]